MAGLATNPKVFLTTCYRRFRNDYWDAVGGQVFDLPRVASPRKVSVSLRFIKQNVSEIEILEYPSWNEYVAKLREGWDIVGFSFFHHDLWEILEMAEEARRQGVKEIWAGGYGALSDESARFADRVFTVYVEDQLNREIFGRKLDRLRHPPIVNSLNLHVPPRFLIKK
ncbi:hypothetical protein JXM67_14120 [candidate division WOR-3 bacterium]|nr:hypothetical protein [candidate division WOR-3 bacterium]